MSTDNGFAEGLRLGIPAPSMPRICQFGEIYK
jgi:hypothetical protein